MRLNTMFITAVGVIVKVAVVPRDPLPHISSNCTLFFSFLRHFEIPVLNSQTPVPHSPFPVFRVPFPVPRSPFPFPFPVPCFPFLAVRRSQFPVELSLLLVQIYFSVHNLLWVKRYTKIHSIHLEILSCLAHPQHYGSMHN